MFKIYPGFWTQIILMSVSTIGLIGYYFSFRLGRASVIANSSQIKRKILKFLYHGGASTFLIWIIMIFLSQPRFHGLIDAIRGREVSTVGLIISTYGLLIFVFFGIWNFLATRENSKVTLNSKLSLSNYDYLAPNKLLTTGYYRIVRHPMVICTFFNMLGLSLLMGAYYTTMFLPVYFILNDALNWIQEKYVLEVEFPTEYKEYKKKTPRILNWWLTLLLILGGIAITANFTLVDFEL